MRENSDPIAIFLGFLGGGGAERVIVSLTRGFINKGLKVDLVLSKTESPHLWQVPPEVRIVDLASNNLLRSVPALIGYLRREKPIALLTTLHYTNEIAILAKRLSGVSTRVVVREANTVSQVAKHGSQFKRRLTPFFIKFLYPWADGIVAVSQGVAQDLVNIADLPSESIQVIYNPVMTSEILAKAKEPVDHPWFAPGQPPVILGVGKLTEQKDFPTLIRAFAEVRKVKQARLVILGWGALRPQLEALVRELGLEEDVALLDHVKNPYAYMKRSALFVLSSAWEGLPNVLIEAMAVGIPVVSTDCPSGPSEILDRGKYGSLIPVGDTKAMAAEILSVLSGNSKSVDPTWLDRFSLETATQKYLEVLSVT